MEHSDRLICNIANELKEAALRTEKEIMNHFPPLLSYELLTGHQRYISHDFDPPWDSSGFLFSKSSDISFDISVYKKVEDFFVNYTGNSKATYTPGCGLYHETYVNKLWPLLEKKYKLTYQKPFPKRIEMPEFISFQQFLDDHNVQKQERVLIGKYAPISFSNSVFFKLSSK